MNNKTVLFSTVFLVLALIAAALGPAPTLAAAPGTRLATEPGVPPAGLSAAEWDAIRSQIQSQTAGTNGQVMLKASNAEAEDNFGDSVAISGDTLVVGAGGEDGKANGGPTDNSMANAGAAYVFVRSAGVWTQQARLKAPNAGAGDGFGGAVAIDGDTIVVGAAGEDSSATGGLNDNSAHDAGAIYVFIRNSHTWGVQAMLKASNADANDLFGGRVAIDGNTIVASAMWEDGSPAGGPNDNYAHDAGAAYVFVRSGVTWSQQARLKASNGEADDRFSWSVAIDGNTIVASADLEDSCATAGPNDNSCTYAGAAYVFTRSGSTWSQQAMLKASNADANDLFGCSVSISGDTLVVGAQGESGSATGGLDDNSLGQAGAAYIFNRSAGVWSQQTRLKGSIVQFSANFGYSVAIDGDTILAGAIYESADPSINQSYIKTGVAYTFVRKAGAWSQTARLTAFNAGADDNFGYSVAVDGDTYLVGAWRESSLATGNPYNDPARFAGAAYVQYSEKSVYLSIIQKP